MSTASRWLNWTPSQPQIIEASPKTQPTKPSKPGFVGFEGSTSREKAVIRDSPSATPGCPYRLPAGVRLARYTRKNPPVVIAVCSVVTDVDKFIRHALAQLNVRLHNPVQIKAGDSVFELLSKLADCGLELRLEGPHRIETDPESE